MSCLGYTESENAHGKTDAESDNYSEDSEDIDYAAGESGVQLGTVVPLEGPQARVLFKNVDWHDWDGGKAGGWPVRLTLTLTLLLSSTW